jgi:hypothetical protein
MDDWTDGWRGRGMEGNREGRLRKSYPDDGNSMEFTWKKQSDINKGLSDAYENRPYGFTLKLLL